MGKRVDPVEAATIMRAAALEPQGPYPGSNAPWKCTCLKCGDGCAPRFGDVRKRGSGGLHQPPKSLFDESLLVSNRSPSTAPTSFTTSLAIATVLFWN